MACNNGNGNRAYQKSCVRYFNNAPQLLAADGENVLTLAGAKVVNSGSSIQVEPQSYDTVKIGLYHLAADAVIAATAATTPTRERTTRAFWTLTSPQASMSAPRI